MSLWTARDLSNRWTKGELAREWGVIEEGFTLVGLAIDRFNVIDAADGSIESKRVARAAGLLTAKANALLHSCFSLALDAHAQEAGALLRPLIEAIELLAYVRLDSSRASDLLDGRQPKAGAVSKAVEGHFHGLRTHLNDHASHLALSVDAIAHLVERASNRIRANQTHDVHVLRTNLVALNAFQCFVLLEATNCLLLTDGGSVDLARAVTRWHRACTAYMVPDTPGLQHYDA